jgi:hypothetical protein
LRPVNVARGTKGDRPILDTVLIDSTPDDGTRLVSTDTYRLAWADVKTLVAAPTGQTMLPPEIVTSLVKAVTPAKAVKWGRMPLAVEITQDETWITSTVTTAEGTVSARAPRQQGEYPRWRQLLVTEGPTELAAFSPKYLGGLAEIAKVAPFPTAPAKTVSMSGPGKAAEWTIGADGLTIHYLLMPVKVIN